MNAQALKRILLGSGAVFASTVMAANSASYFVTPGGGELTAPANWSPAGVPVFTTAADAPKPIVKINDAAPAKLTLAEDTTFLSFAFDAVNPSSLTFNLGGNTLSVWGTGDGAFNPKAYKALTITNGTLQVAVGSTAGNRNYRQEGMCTTSVVSGVSTKLKFPRLVLAGNYAHFSLLNGASFEGSLSIGGNPSTGLVCRVSGSDPATGTPSTFDLGTSATPLVFDGSTTLMTAGPYPTLEVSDGAVLTNFTGSLPNRGSNLRVLVDHATFHCRDALSVGATSMPQNNAFFVRNGGKLVLPGTTDKVLLVGGGAGSNNCLRIEDSTLLWRRVAVGGASATGNEMVLSNATVGTTVAGQNSYIYVGGKSDAAASWRSGTNNTLRVMDCHWISAPVSIEFAKGVAACSNTVCYARCVLTNTCAYLCATRSDSFGNRMILTEGTDSYATANTWPQLNGSENVLRLEKGSRAYFGNREAQLTLAANGNRVEVVGGSTLGVGQVSVGDGSSLVISNGTLDVSWKLNTVSATARFVFQGDSSQLNLGASYPDGSRFEYPVCDLTAGIYRFELSPTSYTRAAYYGRKALTVSDTADFEFDFTKVSDAGGSYALVQSGGTLTVTEAALEKIRSAVVAAQTAVGGRMIAKLRQQDNTLTLDVRPRKGLILVYK